MTYLQSLRLSDLALVVGTILGVWLLLTLLGIAINERIERKRRWEEHKRWLESLSNINPNDGRNIH